MPDMKQIAQEAAFWPDQREAAEEYCLPYRTVRRLVAEGEIASIKIGKRRVDPESIERWLESQYRPGEA